MPVQDTVYLTNEAMSALKAELDHLRITRRREVADMLSASRDNDLADADDAPYNPARDEQAFVEGRILEIESLLALARPLDEGAGKRSGRVALGSTAIVEDAAGKPHTYMIVDGAETNPAQGKVSDASPVGRALLGAAPGDVVTVVAPAGPQKLLLREIR